MKTKEQNIIDNYGEIIIYQTEDGLTKLEVKMEDETVWLTQQQMAELFQTSRTNVVDHIKNIYEEVNQMKIQPVGNSDRFGWKEASLDATEEGRPLYKKNRDLKIRLRNIRI